jgi:gamma-glutamylcyclotransferase (GGCT)/AIG2-like uncharacterized protein YtfP
MKKREKVFVYGSLRKGLWLSHYLKTSKYLGEVWVPGVLFQNPHISGEKVPGMTLGSATSTVVGEIYEVTPEVLRDLDLAESHPWLYKRELAATTDGQVVWVYTWPHSTHPPIPSGDWKEFLNQTKERS